MNKLVFIDSQTINRFIDDSDAFDLCTIERFRSLDKDGDNTLTRSDLCNNLGALFTDEERDDLVDKLFEQFDEDRDGKIGFDEFKSMLKEMMVALARGIGPVPVFIALQSDCVFMKAVHHEIEFERNKKEIEANAAAAAVIVKEAIESTTTTGTKREKTPPSSPQRNKEKKSRLSSSGLLMCFVCGNHSTKIRSSNE